MSLHTASSSKEPSAQVVELWKRSKVPVEAKPEDLPITRTTVAQRLSGERSWLWTNISQMSPLDQAQIISNVASNWPYASERRALNWPIHAGIIANCVSSTMIATKISADMVLFNPKMSLLDAIRQCPRSPFVFGVYTSGLTYYMLRQEPSAQVVELWKRSKVPIEAKREDLPITRTTCAQRLSACERTHGSLWTPANNLSDVRWYPRQHN
ncbi:hypothetical protein OSTOST_12601 [Ostertagia ostertagi]